MKLQVQQQNMLFLKIILCRTTDMKVVALSCTRKNIDVKIRKTEITNVFLSRTLNITLVDF